MALIPFLRDRPVIYSGIKFPYINVDVECIEPDKFQTLCDYISNDLKIEVLGFRLDLKEETAQELTDQAKDEHGLLNITTIPVSKCFHLNLLIEPSKDRYDLIQMSEDQMMQEYKMLKRKYTPFLEDGLRPNTLCKAPSNEIEEYLSSRLHSRSTSSQNAQVLLGAQLPEGAKALGAGFTRISQASTWHISSNPSRTP